MIILNEFVLFLIRNSSSCFVLFKLHEVRHYNSEKKETRDHLNSTRVSLKKTNGWYPGTALAR